MELIGSFELVGPYEAIGSPELISSFEAIHSLELVEPFEELGHRTVQRMAIHDFSVQLILVRERRNKTMLNCEYF